MTRTHSLWGASLLLLLTYWLALNSLVGDSPTMDEQNHLARGLALLRTGDPRLSLEHPPLINTLSALPLLTLPEVRLPFDDPSWGWRDGWYRFAELLLWEYNQDVTRLVFLARLPIVWLLLGLAAGCYQAARYIWPERGRTAGLATLALLVWDPNLLAHGRYTTTDLGGTAMIVLATWWLWRWQRRPYWSHFLLAGLGVGLALGSKLSAVAFVPIWGLMALLPPDEAPWQTRAALHRVAQTAAAGLLGLVVVWVIFGLEWGALRFETPHLLPLNQLSGPMPTFWAGIERILLISEGGRASFLLGQVSTEGFWAYFPVAFMVKTPLPTLILVGLAVGYGLRRPGMRRRTIWLLTPAVLYFALSMQSALNIGYRHLLPMLPFLFILVGGYIAQVRHRAWAALNFGLLLAVGATSWLIHPHYLSYFNQLAGGPDNGYRVLIDSNLDWGQDLLRLHSWMAEHEVAQVKLAWFGSADPAYYGLAYEPLPGLPRHFDLWWNPPFNPDQPEPGIYAISASNLWELPLAEKNVFPWFRARPPDDRVGYSILIYEVP